MKEGIVKRFSVVLFVLWLVLTIATTAGFSVVLPAIGALLEANGIEVPGIFNAVYALAGVYACVVSAGFWLGPVVVVLIVGAFVSSRSKP